MLKKYFTLFLIGSIVFAVLRLEFNIKSLLAQNEIIKHGFRDLVVTEDADQFTFHSPEMANSMLETSAQRGIFKVNRDVLKLEPVRVLPQGEKNEIHSVTIHSQEETDAYFKLDRLVAPELMSDAARNIYLQVQMGPENRYYPTGPLLRSDLLLQGSRESFSIVMVKEDLPFSWSHVKV